MKRTRLLCALVLVVVVFARGRVLPAFATDDATLARGEYLTRIGNCAGCHTAPGGADFSGGLHLASPYGTFITPNITPDKATGIGDWSDTDFWNALHNGQRADGAPLYPACPYASFTHVARADVEAIHAYLESVPAVEQRHADHDIGFPYNRRWLVNVWQWLYFEPGALAYRPQQSVVWQRGRYLVEGLGHCNACHRARGTFGATRDADDAPGAMIHGWYAPPLADPAQAGLQRWPIDAAAHFLQAGKSAHAATMGPMADVVFQSLQYLRAEDARAMATYLKAIQPQDVESPLRLIRLSGHGRQTAMNEGKKLYADHCAGCHGDRGNGGRKAPALAGNRAVTMQDPVNIANMIRAGGFPPATAGNPRPYGMPPFYDFNDRELAAVISYIRGSWGNDAAPVTATNLKR